ncbi:MAG: disulfide bond formation protein B [Oceanospirillaceae bacterium]|jgi:disulfide bond formation protein DsbB|uniref:disulfide bond formation protein B n=1 Tax=Marinobacterium litorale TaxID=404770 RepID=UPI0004097B0B|nr:disulfide bond formation protein B [Marinobacterium litorale]MBS97714.1 disulfide bond formation protein B [Oceanospirillaceae bacterium]
MNSPSLAVGQHSWNSLFIAWLVALAATLGALFIGEIMGQVPCQLCWYQRIAMFPLALILGVACATEDPSVHRYAVPLAGAGAAVALWHNLLFFGVIPAAIQPCGQGPSCSSADMTILGGLPLPLLSLAAFAIIFFLLFNIRLKTTS